MDVVKRSHRAGAQLPFALRVPTHRRRQHSALSGAGACAARLAGHVSAVQPEAGVCQAQEVVVQAQEDRPGVPNLVNSPLRMQPLA